MNQPESASPLARRSDGLYYTGTFLSFRITKLTTYNLERLKITLKAFLSEKPEEFHIDTLDLYSSRMRESFIESCQKYLKTKPEHINADLTSLI